MKIFILFCFFASVVVILTSCNGNEKGGETTSNDSIAVKVVFSGSGDNSVHTYPCTRGDTIKVKCPDGTQYSYVVCEEGETINISCIDTVHRPDSSSLLYNPLRPDNPVKIEKEPIDTVH